MNNFIRDVRYGVRTLLKSPRFTVFAVMTLALGIGVNTAIFSVADAILFRALPFGEHLKRRDAVFKSSHIIEAANQRTRQRL